MFIVGSFITDPELETNSNIFKQNVTVEYYSVIKRSKALTCAILLMNLKSSVLRGNKSVTQNCILCDPINRTFPIKAIHRDSK